MEWSQIQRNDGSVFLLVGLVMGCNIDSTGELIGKRTKRGSFSSQDENVLKWGTKRSER